MYGGATEYIISFLGEKILNTRWWDYSDKFLNLNGRVCLVYCVFWGILGLYLLKVFNPKVDKFLDWVKLKANGKTKLLKAIVLTMIIFLFLDFLATGIASDFYFTRITVENDLPVANKEKVVEKYNYLYKENPKLANIIYKFWGNEVMVKTLPNATIMLENGDLVLAKNYSPDIKPYYYKFKK